jgi:hypothetical protein
MKKQPKIKLSLAKETIAKLNEEQMALVAGGYGISNEDSTIIIVVELSNETGEGGGCYPSVWKSKTCPPTGTCKCTCD